LLDICIKKGLNLQTHTPVVEVSQHPTRDSKTEWIVHTEVILATNAYTAALYPPAAEFIIPTRARVAAIRPGSNIANNPALKRTMILEGPISGEYMQSRAEGFSGAGDVIIGGHIFSYI
jgi:glycine/D-amino acid oxidase-like deaminating enzyme